MRCVTCKNGTTEPADVEALDALKAAASPKVLGTEVRLKLAS